MNSKTLILISVVAYGIWAIFQKLAVSRMHPIHMQAVGCCVAITLLPIYLCFSYYKIPHTISTAGIIFSVLASVCSVVATLAFLFAIQNGNVGTTSVLVAASPVITIALAVVFLGEKLTLSKLIGVAFVMFGVIVLGH
jgi:uncharacterized membrane protein